MTILYNKNIETVQYADETEGAQKKHTAKANPKTIHHFAFCPLKRQANSIVRHGQR